MDLVSGSMSQREGHVIARRVTDAPVRLRRTFPADRQGKGDKPGAKNEGSQDDGPSPSDAPAHAARVPLSDVVQNPPAAVARQPSEPVVQRHPQLDAKAPSQVDAAVGELHAALQKRNRQVESNTRRLQREAYGNLSSLQTRHEAVQPAAGGRVVSERPLRRKIVEAKPPHSRLGFVTTSVQQPKQGQRKRKARKTVIVQESKTHTSERQPVGITPSSWRLGADKGKTRAKPKSTAVAPGPERLPQHPSVQPARRSAPANGSTVTGLSEAELGRKREGVTRWGGRVDSEKRPAPRSR